MTADAPPPLRLGLVGAGRWGRVLIRVIRETPGLDLCWLASTAPDAAALLRPGATVARDWRALAEAARGPEALDGVVIATPAPAHAAPLRLALEVGLPAIVEKPLTTSVEEAESLVALQRETGVPVLVDHTAIFHPGYARLRELVRPERVRTAVSVGGQWGRRGGDVGALWDYGPHDLALCLDLLGLDARLDEATIVESATIEGAPCEVVRLALSWPSGARAEATFGNAMRTRRRWFAVDDGTQVLTLDGTAEPALTRHATGTPLIPDPADRAGTPTGEAIAIAPGMPLDHLLARFGTLIRAYQSSDRTARADAPAANLDLALAITRVIADAAQRTGHLPAPSA